MAETPATNITSASSDERMFAMFSHLSIFFGGILVPLIFWAINKDKSKFVSFHSLQALFFHLAFAFIVIVLVFFIIFGAVGMNIFVVTAGKARGGSIILIILIFAIYGLIFLSAASAVIYSIYMAVKSYGGNLNKYPIIGNIIYKKVYGNN